MGSTVQCSFLSSLQSVRQCIQNIVRLAPPVSLLSKDASFLEHEQRIFKPSLELPATRSGLLLPLSHVMWVEKDLSSIHLY